MKKKDTFKINTDGVETVAIVVTILDTTEYTTQYLCYANNKLFIVTEQEDIPYFDEELDQYIGGDNTTYMVWGTIVENCIIPEYDTILELAKAEFNKEEAKILFS